VADDFSDPEKGTGAVKITPAHDFNDFEVGRRHELPMPSILDRQAHVVISEIADVLRPVEGAADPAFTRSLEGMDRNAARKAIVAELERFGLLEKVEPNTHQVPHGDRGGVPLEPMLTTQWYCNAKVLAQPAIQAVETGKTVFVPKQWENTFFAWMRDIQPWCISRQLWWGHQIPCWYGPDGHEFVAESETEAKSAARDHYKKADVALTRDEDVLDTWFSSALWPFSTLGWPESTKELSRYYPGDVLVTGFDIIFFWVARMMMQGIHFMDDVPFRTVYIHGLVRDERGQKMSKSKGNSIDPLELIDKYGADALRFTICALTGLGRDVKLGPARVESYRRFVTKLWNAARFCEMNDIRVDPSFDPARAFLPLTRWILDAANRAIEEATAALEAYRLDEYAAICYRFTWDTFCDWFVEFAKPALAEPEVRQTAAHVLGTILRLLHPVMPFVTEELWDRFGYGEPFSLIRAPWPEPVHVPDATAARAELDWVVQLISEVRSVRSEMNVSPAMLTPILLRDATSQTLVRAQQWIDAIRRLARASEVTPLVGEMPKGSAQLMLDEATVVLPLADAIDVGAERMRLTRERDKAAGEARKIGQKLDNADFVRRAPEEVVEENRERLAAINTDIARLEAALQRIEA
jgi:valyl-tRNA synthetase